MLNDVEDTIRRRKWKNYLARSAERESGMRLGKYLSSLTKPELEELKELLNLTDDEEKIFNGLSKGRGKIQVASDCMVSSSTVDNRIKSISLKLARLRGGIIGNFI